MPGAVRECAHAGVSVGYIMTAGFAELGPQGAALEREASAAAAETGMRLLGPNSNGMISARAGLAASIMTTVSDLEPPLIDDGVAVISQSGAVGTFILTACLEAGLSVGTYFSTGNECDVGFEEILGRLVDDPSVKVILAYIEGLRNGVDFVSAAARARESGKPLVVLKVGVTEEGATASASHTAAMAGAEVSTTVSCVARSPSSMQFERAGACRRGPLQVRRKGWLSSRCDHDLGGTGSDGDRRGGSTLPSSPGLGALDRETARGAVAEVRDRPKPIGHVGSDR